jgi:HSP20 family protein
MTTSRDKSDSREKASREKGAASEPAGSNDKTSMKQGNGRESQGSRELSAPYQQHRGLSSRQGWEPFRRMRDEFDRVFDQFFHNAWNAPIPWSAGDDWRLGFDVEEDDRTVTVRAEAPGFEPDDFDLQVQGDQLMLRAIHKSESQEKEQGFREWRRQEFFRSVPLPAGVDAEHVEAQYRQGVLTVNLPKTEQSKGHRIAVRG